MMSNPDQNGLAARGWTVANIRCGIPERWWCWTRAYAIRAMLAAHPNARPASHSNRTTSRHRGVVERARLVGAGRRMDAECGVEGGGCRAVSVASRSRGGHCARKSDRAVVDGTKASMRSGRMTCSSTSTRSTRVCILPTWRASCARGAFAVIHHPGRDFDAARVRAHRSDLTDALVLAFAAESGLDVVEQTAELVNAGDAITILRKPATTPAAR